jgi:hypothetical protein
LNVNTDLEHAKTAVLNPDVRQWRRRRSTFGWPRFGALRTRLPILVS